jgi:aerobic carbon-monoxide dehydrogenase large subunit
MSPLIGKPLRRKEDLRLLTGGGRYSDDVNLPGQAYACVLRSPHAHARIRSIDTVAAQTMPGVLAVLTGADVKADGLRDIPHTPIPAKPPADILLVNSDGSEHGYAPQDLLPTDRVRYVGQQVAMVVAETVAQAKDAAEHIAVEYEPLDPVIAGAAAVQTGAVRLYDRVANTCVDADVGNRAATQAAFDRASRFARIQTTVQRVTGVPLDLRAAVGVYDPATRKYTLHAGSGAWCGRRPSLPASSACR